MARVQLDDKSITEDLRAIRKRRQEIEDEKANIKKKYDADNSLPLGGKSTVMRQRYGDAWPGGLSRADYEKNYNQMQNHREEDMENLQKRVDAKNAELNDLDDKRYGKGKYKKK